MSCGRTQVLPFSSPKRGSSSPVLRAGLWEATRTDWQRDGAAGGCSARHSSPASSRATLPGYGDVKTLGAQLFLLSCTEHQAAMEHGHKPSPHSATSHAPCSSLQPFRPLISPAPRKSLASLHPCLGWGLGLPRFAGRAVARGPRRALPRESRGLRHPMRRAVIS